jgi:hypothetical protein
LLGHGHAYTDEALQHTGAAIEEVSDQQEEAAFLISIQRN